jgi:hypothetical protein
MLETADEKATREAKEKAEADANKKNVAPSCLKVAGTAPNYKMYNDCFNVRQLRVHNWKRSLHEARELSFNTEAAQEIQRILNGMTRGEPVTMPESSTRPLAFRNCGQNVYQGTDTTITRTTGTATRDWYDGYMSYNFDTHAPKS